jgi:ribosomal protein L16/L10AE
MYALRMFDAMGRVDSRISRILIGAVLFDAEASESRRSVMNQGIASL